MLTRPNRAQKRLEGPKQSTKEGENFNITQKRVRGLNREQKTLVPTASLY